MSVIRVTAKGALVLSAGVLLFAVAVAVLPVTLPAWVVRICRGRECEHIPSHHPARQPQPMGPDHPDQPYQPGAWLQGWERWQWDDIEARLEDAGLDILDSGEAS